jgi:diguanylate cyclase (GGDEF)-like protein
MAASQPYRVLVIDDDLDLANHTTLVLRHAGVIAECLNDPTKVLDRIAAFAPELLLVDLHMPVCTGAELSSVIRQQEEFAAIPIVFLSQETDAERQSQAMGHGGDEFLLKSVEPRHLVAAVRARAHRFRQLRSLLMRDSLTGLLNHSTTQTMLEAEIRRAGRSNLPVVLAIIDIDHFKKVNDVHGHAVGDEVIKSLATLLRQGLRNSEIVGRVGGEEFAAALVGIGIEAAVERFDALRQDFERIEHRAKNGVLHTTFSCGVAAFPGYPDAKSLSKAADEALYTAKNAGRNRVVVAEKPAAAPGAARSTR